MYLTENVLYRYPTQMRAKRTAAKHYTAAAGLRVAAIPTALYPPDLELAWLSGAMAE